MKTYVLGDLHGGYKALKQVLERSNFDYEIDRLISLGDVADGWPEVVECFDELLKIKNLIMVRGNHDQWLLDWMEDGFTPDIWVNQGGRNSLDSYINHSKVNSKKKNKHHKFLKKTPLYYIDDKNRLFVHGGYIQGVPMDKQHPEDLMWSRALRHMHPSKHIEDYSRVFVGHTTVFRESSVPLNVGKVTFMDTGGGWEGKLSLMNVDTDEVFQSDMVHELYPDIRPRG